MSHARTPNLLSEIRKQLEKPELHRLVHHDRVLRLATTEPINLPMVDETVGRASRISAIALAPRQRTGLLIRDSSNMPRRASAASVPHEPTGSGCQALSVLLKGW